MQNRRNSRSLFVFVLVAGIAVITGFWYFASGASNGDAPVIGGEYVEGVTGAPSMVNPLFATQNDADQTLTALVFAGLTRLDDRGAPYPDLASTWSVSPDGLTYVFSLRAGLQWHDGAPLTSADALFTYELLRDPALLGGPPVARRLNGATVTAPDAMTVAITLPEAYAPLPAYLTVGILPAHLLGGQSVTQIGESFFNQQPVGSGPYRLDRLTPSEAMLSANPTYHLKQPFIQQLRLRFFRDDGELFSALEAGEVQGALSRGVLGEREQLILQRRSDLNVTPVVTGGVASVYFNLETPLFRDRRVRQALLYGLDRDAMIGELVEGQAAVAQSPIVPGSWAYAGALERYGADEKQAGLLLDDAGWRRDGDGVRRKDGQALAFAITTTPDPGNFAAAQAVAAEWNELGAQVQIVSVGTTTLVRELIEAHRYEALLLTQAQSVDPDPFEQWHSASASSSANLSGFFDRRVDSLLEEARNATFPRRKEIYESFQELFAQEVPAIPLYASTAYYVQSGDVQGVRVGLLTQPGDRFWQVQEWFLKKR